MQQIVQLVPEGATIQLESVAPFCPRLADIAGELEVALGGEEVDVNVYLAPSKDHSAFGVHHDVVDVFVLQIAGRKHWRVFEPIIQNPIWYLKSHNYEVDESHLILDVNLEPGDVLYVRRGDPHLVQCVGDEPSLHVNLRIIPTTRKSFLDWLVQEAAERAEFRSALPYALDGKDITEDRISWVSALSADFATWVLDQDPGTLLDNYFAQRTAHTQQGIVSLPDLVVGPIETFDSSTGVCMAHPQLRARIAKGTLFALGQEIELPAETLLAIEHLTSHPSQSSSALELAELYPAVPVDALVRVMKELVALSILRRAEI